LKVLVVDNYDSFTYNIVDLLRSHAGIEFEVAYNDQLNWNQVDHYHKILISPGPGTPDQAGLLLQLIAKFYKTKSVLGICLGHQAIAQVFGGKLINLSKPRHGQKVLVHVQTADPLFSGIPEEISGGLYHSWSVDWDTLPDELQIIASSNDGIMGIRHREFDVAGLQFHPESYATQFGADILQNWLSS
jgi:anthranilate synthase component 2